MDVVAATLVRDAFGRRVAAFDPRKDLPNVVAWYDAADLTGANNSAVSLWRDRSTLGNDLAQGTSSTQPTLKTGGPNGRTYLHFGATSFIACSGLGLGFRQQSFAQPNTIIVVGRVGSSVSGVARNLIGNTSGTRQQLQTNAADNCLQVVAGSSGAHGGAPINDDTWHVFVAESSPTFNAHYVDGTLVAVAPSQSQGTNAMGGLAVGADTAGVSPLQDGDITEVIVCNGRLTPQQLDKVTAYVAAKSGITVLPSAKMANSVDTTDSAGQAVRYFLPPNPAASIPWLLWFHPATQNQQITPSYFAYPLVHAAMQQGWGVIASNMHGDNWGADTVLTDSANLYTLANSLVPASSLILVGASMGGLAVETILHRGTLPSAKIKGAVHIDSVFDLTWAYTGNSGAYTTAINTAYSISAVGSIPPANDPMQRAASSLTATPRRFYASTADTNVVKANNVDAYRTKIASMTTPPTEYALVTHNETGHISNVRPRDLVPFIQRCLA